MTVHATPPHGEAVTSCCGAAPVELPEGDGLTLNPAAITCTTNHTNRSEGGR